MFNIQKILRSLGVVAVLVACALLIGQVMAPSAAGAGPMPSDLIWGSSAVDIGPVPPPDVNWGN